MDQGIIIELFRNAIYTMVTVVSPILIIAMFVGIIVALFQATTQINEQTMVFVPKILSVFIGILVLGAWMLSTVGEYTIQLFESILTYV